MEKGRDRAKSPYPPLPIKPIVYSKKNYKNPNRGILGEGIGKW